MINIILIRPAILLFPIYIYIYYLLYLMEHINIILIRPVWICPSLAVLAVVICGVGVRHSICRSISHLPQCHQVEYGVRGEGYNNNYNNTGSGGQRGWEKCDTSIAVFLTQG